MKTGPRLDGIISNRKSVLGKRKEVQPLQLAITPNENERVTLKNKSTFTEDFEVKIKRFCTFSALPSEHLNSLGMICYDKDGKLRRPLPMNIAPHVMSPTLAMALDCEYVDIGKSGERDLTLARISIVNEYGFQMYHAFVKPATPVHDYCTRFSGIREQDLEKGVSLNDVHQATKNILDGKILVGHSIDQDLKISKLKHPENMIRDTASFFSYIYKRKQSLKFLVQNELGVEIQEGEHEPTEDAQAAMKLYLRYRSIWENLRQQKLYQLTHEKRLLPVVYVEMSCNI